MAISCPSCQAGIAVADVNVSEGIALCRACNQVCRLADLAAAAPAAVARHPRCDKPAGTRIELAELGEKLVVAVPRGMNKGLGLFLLAFGGIWDGVSAIILVSMLAGLRGGGHGGAAADFDWFGLLFVGFFFLIGFAVLVGAAYVLTVRIAMSIDRDNVTLVRAAFGREWASVRPTASAISVSRVERYKQNNVAKYGAGIEFNGGGTLAIGSALSEPELDWLCGELAHALRRCGAQVT